MDLSVAIIARDAETDLGSCLASLKGLTDDVVLVVDDRTSDNTATVAKKLGAKTFTKKFVNFANQKNFAVSCTAHDWVLSLDADEEVSPELHKEISSIDFKSTPYSAFKIPRLNFIFGKPIYHTNWGPGDDSHIWLFKKSHGKWIGQVHEEVMVKGKVGTLNASKLHHNYQTVEQFIQKMNTYTSFESEPTNPVYDFLRRYVWHLGFLDGWHGLFLSYLQAMSHIVVWIKLWEKKKLSSS